MLDSAPTSAVSAPASVLLVVSAPRTHVPEWQVESAQAGPSATQSAFVEHCSRFAGTINVHAPETREPASANAATVLRTRPGYCARPRGELSASVAPSADPWNSPARTLVLLAVQRAVAASTTRWWPWLVGLALLSIVANRLRLEHTARQVAAIVTPRQPRESSEPVAERRSLSEACAAAGVPYPPPAVHIVVEKSLRRLTLLSGDRPIVRYRVGLGFAPAGNKSREGDGRTPEGELRVVTRNDKSRFRRFLGLSYPRPADITPGAATADERAAIERAFREGGQPPWETPLGGAVGIHGHGGSSDWTSGCVAVDDAAIDLLWEAAPLGTPVRVLP